MNSIESRRVTYEARISSIHGIEFIRWQSPFKNNTTRAVVRHHCGYEWAPVAASLFTGKGCPKCSGRVRPSPDEYESRINNSGIHDFVSWCGDGRGPHDRVIVRCKKGHDMQAVLYNIISQSISCPTCNKKKRLSEDEHISRINEISGISFVRWVSAYEGSRSRFIALHSCGNEAETTYGDAKRYGGCHACTKYGYKDDRPGYLYHLKSKCGNYLKVGITHNPKRRFQELRRSTPFSFSVSSVTKFEVGGDARRMESDCHASMSSAGFSGFSGATEWFITDK